MEIVCLDTDILIDYWRAKNKTATLFYQLSEKYNLAITAITIYEVYKGDNSEEDLFWDAIFKELQILPLDVSASQTAGSIATILRKKGRPVAVEDLLIASIAISNKMKIATNNKKHFASIQELVVV